MIRGKDIDQTKLASVNGVDPADVADQTKLGRIKIGKFDGTPTFMRWLACGGRRGVSTWLAREGRTRGG